MAETEPQSNSGAVVADNLVKQFGRFAALRGISTEFSTGNLYVIVGDNGAGKTTLLRTIAGLAHPTRGTISVLGERNLKMVRAQIGYMAHPSLLYDEMSAMENLRYFAGLYGVEDARCRDVIATVKLDPDLDRPVGQYSQGMRQRLSLARALLNDPKLLLLDEPFSNVDYRSAHEMTALLAEMRKREKTIFVVTHQPALLESVADAMSFFAVTRAALAKDIRLEWRSKDAINAMLFFSLLVVVIFSFAFDPTAEESRRIAGGLIWVAFLFAAIVALNQTWARELRNQVLDAYRVSPAPANPLFLSKALGNFIFVGVLELLMTPLFIGFYKLRALGPAWQFIPIGVLGTWALVVNGTFFAAISLRTRSREIMLPLLLFPLSIPALIAMVSATTALLTGEESARFWIALLVAYDVVFTTACLFLFETVLDAE